MKKILAMALSVVLCIGMMTGCGSKDDSNSSDNGDAAKVYNR